jgi:glutathione S-transferase
MSTTLYSFPPSIWAAPTRLVFAEKKITDFTIKNIDLSQAENYSPEFLEINPQGYIPVIEVGEKRVIGSTDVCEYIDINWDGPKLLPSDEAKAKAMRDLIDRFHEADKDPNFLFFGPADMADTQGPKKDLVLAWMNTRLEKLPKFKALAPKHAELYDRKITAAKKLISVFEHPENAAQTFAAISGSWAACYSLLNDVDKHLAANGGPLLFGSEYTLADAHFTAWLARLIDIRKEAVYEDRKHVAKYWAHVQERESFAIVWPKTA